MTENDRKRKKITEQHMLLVSEASKGKTSRKHKKIKKKIKIK